MTARSVAVLLLLWGLLAAQVRARTAFAELGGRLMATSTSATRFPWQALRRSAPPQTAARSLRARADDPDGGPGGPANPSFGRNHVREFSPSRIIVTLRDNKGARGKARVIELKEGGRGNVEKALEEWRARKGEAHPARACHMPARAGPARWLGRGPSATSVLCTLGSVLAGTRCAQYHPCADGSKGLGLSQAW